MNYAADLLIAVAYISIPILLLRYWHQSTGKPRWMLLRFVLFILSCAIGHALESVGVEHSWWHWVTALISGETAIALYRNRSLLDEAIKSAFQDSLTGLRNRAYFRERCHEMLRGRDYSFAVLFIDLDSFKLVNDAMGHLAGDRLLKEIAHRLLSAIRSEDLAARLGGDEFVVLMGIQSAEEAGITADRIVKAIAHPWHFHKRTIYPSASIGIALSKDCSNYDELMNSADSAMYAIKGTAQRYSFVSESQQNKAAIAIEMIDDLHHAFERKEFVLHYQPIVELKTRKIAGYEALVRWQHPTKGLLLPGVFLPFILQSGRMYDLTEWVLRSASDQATKIAPELYIAINISPTLTTEEVTKLAAIACARTNFEITEDSLSNPETLACILDLKIKLILDDLGTGFSYLQRIADFRWHAIKIDRSFINRESLLPGMVRMIHDSGAIAILEGIEPQMIGLVDYAIELGIECGQGWEFGRPEPLK